VANGHHLNFFPGLLLLMASDVKGHDLNVDFNQQDSLSRSDPAASSAQVMIQICLHHMA
jgi:hypothetical protein